VEPRQRITSGGSYESRVGYSRAVRAGNAVFVAGTVANGADAYEQTKAAIAKIALALREAGATLDDVVRTRLFVTNIGDWERIGAAHAEAFGEIRPACTLVEVSRLIEPQYVVEVEADAIIR
jgi:enamine deaminase RidA (YjgF/YER057c/UK114 family)